MNEIIKELFNTNELVETYTNPNDCDKFGVGYITACTDDEFLIHTFQENDLDDGYYVKRNDSMIRIQRNTIYLNNKLQLIKPKAEMDNLPKGYWPDLDLFDVVLNLCQKKHLVTQVGVEYDFVSVGFVKNISDDVVELENINCDGKPDGITYLRWENINYVGFGGVDEERRALLYKKWARTQE